MSIGQQLRQRREEQSLSLDQASQATHIRVHYLEAMEADQFERLPSSAQLRGFIRAYGEYLKLNSNELLLSLDGELKSTPPESNPALAGEVQAPATSSEAIFTQLGQKLHAQRELMGLSLGDVERHTHIRIHYVNALEQGDISHLPSPVQGRGMLSNYAAFLGLNTEEILLQFADGLQASLYDRQSARNISRDKPIQTEPGRLPAGTSQLRRFFSMELFAAGFLVIFLVGFIIWGAMRVSALNSSKVPTLTAPPVSEILLSTPEDNISGTLTILPTSLVSVVPEGIEATSLVTGTLESNPTETPVVIGPPPGTSSEPIQVYIVAKQQAWMRIIVDGKTAFEGRVIAGSAYSYAGNNQIELLTGDGGGLQVYYNQQDLGILGTFGEVVERIFTLGGVLTPTPSVPSTSIPAPTGTITPTPTSTPKGATSTPLPTLAP